MIAMEIGIDSSSPPEAPHSQASPIVRESEARPEKFVTFQLGEANYAIQAAVIAEVSEILPLTPLPGAPSGLLGISPLRGEIVANVDLRGMLGEKPPMSANPKAKEMIMKRAAAGATPFAFAVDRLGEIATIEISEIKPTHDISDALIGEVALESRSLKVIDHRKVLASIDPEC